MDLHIDFRLDNANEDLHGLDSIEWYGTQGPECKREAGGSRVCKKQLDYIMGPKDKCSATWYLNKVRLRTWDHFSVTNTTEGCELRTKKGLKGWSGWAPKSGAEKSSFKNLFSAHEVSVTKLFYLVMMTMTKDWSFYKKGWLTLQPR